MSDAIRAAASRKRQIDYLAWVLRIVLAVLFVIQGLDKFGHRRLWIQLFAAIGLGQWARYLTGSIEVTSAVLLLVPRATVPTVAALFATMVGALFAHVFILGLGPQTILVLGIMAALITVYVRRKPAGVEVGR